MSSRRHNPDDDLERELRSHLELEAEELGDPHAARRALGNLTAIQETIHDMSRFAILEQLGQDLRYAVRLLRASPAFTLVAVLTLALGIGANTAIFSVVNSVLLRSLPFPDSERLVRVWEAPPGGAGRNVVMPLNFFAWRDRNHSFQSLAAIDSWTANIAGRGQPVAASGMRVTPEFFDVLEVRPLLGRAFIADDGTPGHDDKVILSYGFWQSYFGGDRNVIGRKISMNGASVTVVGVMPPAFRFPGWHAELWVPMSTERIKGRFLVTVARMKPGVSIRQAQAEMRTLAAQLAREVPDVNRGWSADVVPLLDDLTEKVRLPLLVLLGAVALVLLIAGANIANLLLMRAAGRAREIALRAALGASRARIIRQLLAESLLLALIGWAAGLAAGYWGLEGLLAMIPKSVPLPRMESIRLDSGVFLFALGLALATALVFGLAPALQSSRPRLQSALQQGSQRTGVGAARIFRRAFVIAEMALALMLLTAAGLLLRSFARLVSVDPGFTGDRLVTMNMFTPPAKYSDKQKRAQYFDRILSEIRAVPGVESAASVHFLPLTGYRSNSCFGPAPGPQPDVSSPSANFLIVSPGYFQTMGVPLLSGREFGPRDQIGSPSVAVVNRAFARKYFSGADPVGRSLNVCWTVPSPVTIAGVVADTYQTDLASAPEPTIFLDNLQGPMYFAYLVVRSRRDPGQIARSVQAAIHRVDPDQGVSDIETMREVQSDSVSRPRFQLVLLLIFAGIAVLLAGIGVYGVVSYGVTQRTQEIGIRVALGARAGDVSRLVLREGLLLGGAGVAIGLGGAFATTHVLRSLLFEVTPTDPLTLGSVAAALLIVAIAATLVPARRAARVDPIVALRYE